MAFDFPVEPAQGDQITGPYGEIYTWDGEKWTLTPSSAANPDIPALISAQAGNTIVLGTDDKLFSPAWPGISPNAGNLIIPDANQAIYAGPYPVQLTWQIPGGSFADAITYSPLLAVMPYGRGVQPGLSSLAPGIGASPGSIQCNLEAVAFQTQAVTTVGTFTTGYAVAPSGFQTYTNYYGGAAFTNNQALRIRYNAGQGGPVSITTILLVIGIV